MPGGNKAITGADNTQGFQKNPQNINKNGRPQKIYTIIKAMGFSPEDAILTFSELAYYTIEDLEEHHKDETKPALTRIIAQQFCEAYKNKNFSKAKEILEYVIGKPNQPLHITGGIEPQKHTVEFKKFDK